MVRERVGSRMRNRTGTAIPEGVTPEQYERWLAAVERARVRTANEIGHAPAAAVPINLSPGGLRSIDLAEAPPILWYYGRKPVVNSEFVGQQRGSGRLHQGYQQGTGAIRTRYIEPGVVGVRFTNLPPRTPIEQIRQAMGTPDLTEANMFAVRISSQSVLHPVYNASRRVSMYVRNGEAANVFYLRPGAGELLHLYPFDIMLRPLRHHWY
jgi:hypothetical protein